MHEFVELANRVGANTAHFQMMHDWGTYDQETLAKRRVHVTSHPNHAEFVQVLKSLPRPDGLQILSDFSYMT